MHRKGWQFSCGWLPPAFPMALADIYPPACTDEVLDFYQCLGNADANSFVCAAGVVDVAYGANACPTEEAAFFAIDGTNCPAD